MDEAWKTRDRRCSCPRRAASGSGRRLGREHRPIQDLGRAGSTAGRGVRRRGWGSTLTRSGGARWRRRGRGCWRRGGGGSAWWIRPRCREPGVGGRRRQRSSRGSAMARRLAELSTLRPWRRSPGNRRRCGRRVGNSLRDGQREVFPSGAASTMDTTGVPARTPEVDCVQRACSSFARSGRFTVASYT